MIKWSEIILFMLLLFFGWEALIQHAKYESANEKLIISKAYAKAMLEHRITHNDTLEILYWSITQKYNYGLHDKNSR